MNIQKILLSITILVIILNEASAEEKTKTLQKEFPESGETELFVSSSRGTIEFFNEETENIKVDITITVDGKGENDIQKKLDGITVDFTESSNKISIESHIDDHIFNSNWFNINDNKLEINMKIYLPKSLNIEIEQKYGTVILKEHSGQVSIDLSYGKLFGDRITRGNTNPLNSIKTSYSDVKIHELTWSEIESKYSNIDIEKGKVLNIDSKYSKLNLGYFTTLTISAKYDVLNIENVASIISNSAYSKYSVGVISKNVSLDLSYTEFKSDHVATGFSKIEINNRYGTIKLPIDNGGGYYIKGSAQYCNIKIPENQNINIISDKNNLDIEGIVGQSSSNSKVSVTSKYGNIILTN